MPKLLLPVNGRAMFAWLLDLYRSHVDRVVVVVQPSAERQVRAFGETTGVELAYACQASPTGMLDAILLAREQIQGTEVGRVWITWCDQVAVHPRTVANLSDLSDRHEGVPLIMPTIVRRDPYIHFVRDDEGRIVRVLQRREGDAMPARGESDMGLFSLSPEAFLVRLPAFASQSQAGESTRERNFLPFVPWIAKHETVVTFPGIDEMEAIGVNTPAERDAVGAYLAARAGA
jgi:bifunctional N-acetylglucosamine-1-phosphate-uridyltransferase/glucosamine-1-phosphate-acetyltransferase GlmU-like protein